ncbi:MAG: hypothetical protein C4520_05285 [Candidatus Abyssobacteria bacterium SURF_5]|uniref:Uncharacterized protein n=1 Tax=Abyssobacteria bacterium (strain SURF_5) TaxID=2093360 RepID=A0A3A4P0E1_ABYX5|nr:MAG: hypothetical protein C4520_05285 [Candidatus Abyssubacteria bacterium SURF_5]
MRDEVETIESASRLRRLIPFTLLFLIQLSFFSLLAVRRLIDSDEGFYLYISKIVFSEGAIPYRDVFYQQMPLLPYLYGCWMRLFGYTWEAGRIFSALLSAATGALLVWAVEKTTSSRLLAVAAFLLYTLNLSVLLFFLTAKTYALSTSLLFSSIILLGEYKGKYRFGAAGFLLALSVQTRLFFLAAAPALLFFLWKQIDRRRLAAFRDFSTGFVLGLIPSLILLCLAPRQFLFDNVTYHALRDPAGFVGDLPQKFEVVRKLVFSPGTFRPTQLSLLFAAFPVAIIAWKRMSDSGKLAAAAAALLGIASLLPTPTFGQYFCVLVPFLALSLLQAIHAYSRPLPAAMRKIICASIALIALLAATAAAPRVHSLFFKGRNVPGIPDGSDPNDWSIATANKIAAIVESSSEGSPVVSSWPGYLLSADRTIYPKMENQISIGVSEDIPPETADALKLLRKDDLRRAIADPRVQVVVAGNCMHWWQSIYLEAVAQNGYDLLTKEANALIYIRPRRDSPTGGGAG